MPEYNANIGILYEYFVIISSRFAAGNGSAKLELVEIAYIFHSPSYTSTRCGSVKMQREAAAGGAQA